MKLQKMLCAQFEVDFETELEGMLTGNVSPEIILSPNKERPEAFTHVYWFARAGLNVYPIEISYWVIPGVVYVHELNFVKQQKNKAVFASLSECIDNTSKYLPSQEYRLLHDSAKKVFDSFF